MKLFPVFTLLVLLLAACTFNAAAQNRPRAEGPSAEELKQANNPLATKKTVSIHNYVITSLYGLPDVAMNSLNFRYAQPIGRVFLRASIPLMTSNAPGVSPASNFGDFSLFAIYTFPKKPKGFNIGIGPMLVAPTGSSDFGQGKWQTGLSAVAFFSKSPLIQYGMLLQWQISFADAKKTPAADVNLLTPQLFCLWQLGAGTYLRSTGVWNFDLTNGNYNVPLGIGIGKVIKVGGVLFNIFAEPQFSVLSRGIGNPRFQLFFGFNTQF